MLFFRYLPLAAAFPQSPPTQDPLCPDSRPPQPPPQHPHPGTNTPPSFFKTLVEQTVVVELKNDLSVQGTLKSVDQFLNIKLDDISVLEEVRYPHLVCMGGFFFGGGILGRGNLSGGGGRLWGDGKGG